MVSIKENFIYHTFFYSTPHKAACIIHTANTTTKDDDLCIKTIDDVCSVKHIQWNLYCYIVKLCFTANSKSFKRLSVRHK